MVLSLAAALSGSLGFVLAIPWLCNSCLGSGPPVPRKETGSTPGKRRRQGENTSGDRNFGQSRSPASCPRPSSRTSARRRGKPSKSQSWSQKRRNSSPESHNCPQSSADRSNEITAQQAIVARLEIDRSTSIAAQQATIARIRAQQQGEIQTQQPTIARLQAELGNAIREDQRYWQLYEQGAISASTSDSKSLAAETAQQQLNEGKAKQNQIRQSGQQQINEAQAKLNQIQQSGQQQINEAQAKLTQVEQSRHQQRQKQRF